MLSARVNLRLNYLIDQWFWEENWICTKKKGACGKKGFFAEGNFEKKNTLINTSWSVDYIEERNFWKVLLMNSLY